MTSKFTWHTEKVYLSNNKPNSRGSIIYMLQQYLKDGLVVLEYDVLGYTSTQLDYQDYWFFSQKFFLKIFHFVLLERTFL